MRLHALDIVGLIGALLMLAAYVGALVHKLDPARLPALLMNVIGAGLVLWSLSDAFNLGAAIVESTWALAALIGLARLIFKRR